MKRVAVYCGSRAGRDPDYKRAAVSLGEEIVSRGMELVYGGGSVGLMGVVADTVISLGGRVTGVIPGFLNVREVGHSGLDELIEVKTMHERKLKMIDLAEGFVALPGGFGTMEELFEVLAWSQLDLHPHACGLLNVRGYYDGLLVMLDRMVEDGFLNPQTRALLLAEASPVALLDAMIGWEGKQPGASLGTFLSPRP